MKYINILFLFIFLTSSAQESVTKQSFNEDWKFQITEKEAEQHKTDFDDSEWESVSLPHTPKLEPLVVNNQWMGISWYRKTFEVPQSYADKKVIIEFEAAMNHSSFWVNGQKVGEHIGGYLPVVIDLSEHLKYGEKNSIAVRLDNTDSQVTGPKPLKRRDFCMYGGLYRTASLIVKNKVHITHPILADKVASGGIFVTFPKVDEKESVVKVKTHVANEEVADKQVVVQHKVYFQGELVQTDKVSTTKIEAGKNTELVSEMAIADAKLWSPKYPNLYTIETELLIDGKPVDTETTRIGIREFTFKNNQLYINGKKTFLRGVNRHQEYPFIGYALSENAQYRDAKKIKEAGFDYVRLSHYPQSPAFMDACDELGLVTVDAILGWQYYNDTDAFREYCYRSATDLIRRDRNHASVLAWEVSLNETQMPVPFMQKLHDIVHAEYPDEKAYSCGWKNDVYDIYFQARQHRIKHYDSIQHKPYVVSEYGDWEYHSLNAGLNQHNESKMLRREKDSRQLRSAGEKGLLYQARNLQESHNDNFTTPAFADGYWVMFDYNRGVRNNIESSGVMDIFRLPKFGYYFYKSQRNLDEDTVLHIASHWTPKSNTNIKVFSNCDEVELYLNNKLVARQKPDQDSISTHLAHPPFTFKIEKFVSGTLTAKGYSNGNQISEHQVKSPSSAQKLKIWIDESGRKPKAGQNDVVFLYIAAVDVNGTIVPDYSEEITLSLNGDAKVMNVGTVKAEAGIATALVRIGKKSGNVSAKAHANDLKGTFAFVVK